MAAQPADLLLIARLGHAVAALAYAALAVSLLRDGRLRASPGRAVGLFAAAVGASALWAFFAAWDQGSRFVAPGLVASAADLLRYALWFAFLLAVLQPGTSRSADAPQSRWLRPAAIALVAALAVEMVWDLAVAGALGASAAGGELRLGLALRLALPVLGLLLVEQLFRNLAPDHRWGAKPLCLGLACVFVFDVFAYSEAVLFGRVDTDAAAVRGAVHALAVPLLWVAMRRRGDWVGRMQLSRRFAFYSASLLLAGGYLLFMAAVGYYVRFFGGDWGRALQLALAFGAVLLLLVFVFSGSLRAKLRVFLGKHFFRYRFDYREEWLAFTAMLSTKVEPQEVGTLVVRGLANMVECPAGTLWTRPGGDASFRPAARWNRPAADAAEPDDSAFVRYLQEPGWVIDLDEFRQAPRHYGELALPTWLLADADAWLVVPLPGADRLLGFVVLARPRTPMDIDWEARDLLKTAARQAAGFLAQMHATEALLEARKFEAFNKMSAFVVHDLKNIVTQLSLMLKNAERLHANPEFQQDMLLTVESSLEKMRRLMLQLREGATPPGGAHGVELAPIVRRLEAMARERGRRIETEVAEPLATRGHEERLERVLGHLVHNAFDATPAEGRVWLKAARASGQVKVEIGDTGSGMTQEFVETRLFRPFATTKRNGMGIGTYESLQYLRELGGAIAVDSAPGRGTVITLTMPLFEANRASDLAGAGRG